MIDISLFSFSVNGQDFLLNLKCSTSGVKTSFEYFILNLSNIRSIYLSCDSHSLSTFFSRKIFIPKICFSVPKSFMSNVFDNSPISFQIMSTFCPTINISLTYNKRIMNFPSGNLRTYTHGSTTILLYSSLIMKETNFLYHCHGTYFSPYRIFFFLTYRPCFPSL